jgi:restriction system protein
MLASAEKVMIPSHAALAWPCLQVLQGADGSLTNKQIEGAVADLVGLTDAQRTLKKAKGGGGKRTMLDYKLAWSRTLLRGLGTIENVAPATWAVTEHGKSATEADVLKATQDMIDRLQEGNRIRAQERAQRRAALS